MDPKIRMAEKMKNKARVKREIEKRRHSRRK